MPVNNGKPTTREFYQALLQQNDRMDQMERRILAKLDVLPALVTKIDANESEIDKLRGRSNAIDLGIGLMTLIGTLLGISLGPKQ